MLQFVLVFGLIKIACCAGMMIKPNLLRKGIDFISLGNRLYLMGILRLVLGLVLLLLATQAKWWGFVVILGLMVAAIGMSFFFLPLKRTKKLLKRLQAQSNLILRLLVSLCMLIWLMLICSLLPALPGYPPH